MARKAQPASPAAGSADPAIAPPIDPDAVYRATLRRRGEIAPGVTIPAGTHEVLGSTLASLGDAVMTLERL